MYSLRKPRIARTAKHALDDGASGGMQPSERAGDIAAMVHQESVEALEHARADPAVFAVDTDVALGQYRLQCKHGACAAPQSPAGAHRAAS